MMEAQYWWANQYTGAVVTHRTEAQYWWDDRYTGAVVTHMTEAQYWWANQYTVAVVTQTECEDWIHTAKILMSQLTGESIEELFPQRASTTLSKSSQQPDTSALGYTSALDFAAKDGMEVTYITLNLSKMLEAVHMLFGVCVCGCWGGGVHTCVCLCVVCVYVVCVSYH